MKAWTVVAAALSLTALCACSSTEDDKAPAKDSSVEDQWKYHVKKDYPQWQPPAEPQAQPAAQASQTAAPAVAAPVVDNGGFAEPPGFVVKDNVGTYVSSKPEPVQQGDGYSHYVVKRGDSLWTISKMIYHKADKWQKIYDVNKDVVKDPSKLKPGTDLKIPPP